MLDHPYPDLVAAETVKTDKRRACPLRPLVHSDSPRHIKKIVTSQYCLNYLFSSITKTMNLSNNIKIQLVGVGGKTSTRSTYKTRE